MEVSEKNEIVIIDKNENVVSEDYGFPFYRKGTQYGLIAGAIMSGIALLVNALTSDSAIIGWGFIKYLALGLVLGQLLNNYKRYLPEGKLFKDGMVLGLYSSSVAAVTLAVLNILINLLGIGAGSIEKFGLPNNSFGNMLVVNGLLVFECIVFGLVLTFAWLQLLKDPQPAE